MPSVAHTAPKCPPDVLTRENMGKKRPRLSSLDIKAHFIQQTPVLVVLNALYLLCMHCDARNSTKVCEHKELDARCHKTTYKGCCPKPASDSAERHHATRATNRFTRVRFETVYHTTNRQTWYYACYIGHQYSSCFAAPFPLFNCSLLTLFCFVSTSSLVFFSSLTFVVTLSIPLSLATLCLAVLETSEVKNR